MWKNEKGMALGMAIFFMAAVGAGTFYVVKHMEKTTEDSVREIKDVRARVESKKVFSVAGFVISNNLVLCKSGKWNDGVVPNQCRWFGTKSESNYKAEDFGLKNLRYEKNKLTFDLDTKTQKAISRFPGTITFELVDVNKFENIKKVVGEIPAENRLIDNDHYIVKASLLLKIPDGKATQSLTTAAVFKRPMAIPNVTILSSSCLSQCNAFRGEHSSPSCRGPFSIDINTTTDIVALTENEGPGVLYNLDYERKVSYVKAVKGVTAPANQKIEVPISDFLDAGKKVEWVDKVSCATFVKNVTTRVTKVVEGGPSGTTSEKVIDSDRNVSQHSEPAGSVSYKLDTKSPLSGLEPYRLNQNVVTDSGNIKGKQELNSKTIEVTIYVDPPH